MTSSNKWGHEILVNTAQNMKFPIKDLFSKCDHIRWKLRIWLHLLKKSLIENFFCAVILRLVVDGLRGEGAFLYLADGHIYHTFIPLCLNVFLTFNCYTAFF